MSVRWCDGSESEYDEMCSMLVKNGTFTACNPTLRPNSYVARSDPRDVARVESKTFICSDEEIDAGKFLLTYYIIVVVILIS
jgi:phosphoenolpyruvate carboxykinase (GTP)